MASPLMKMTHADGQPEREAEPLLDDARHLVGIEGVEDLELGDLAVGDLLDVGAEVAGLEEVALRGSRRSRAPARRRRAPRLGERSGMADPRVDDGVEQVDGEVDEHVADRDQQHAALHGDVVAGLDATARCSCRCRSGRTASRR